MRRRHFRILGVRLRVQVHASLSIRNEAPRAIRPAQEWNFGHNLRRQNTIPLRVFWTEIDRVGASVLGYAGRPGGCVDGIRALGIDRHACRAGVGHHKHLSGFGDW